MQAHTHTQRDNTHCFCFLCTSFLRQSLNQSSPSQTCHCMTHIGPPMIVFSLLFIKQTYTCTPVRPPPPTRMRKICVHVWVWRSQTMTLMQLLVRWRVHFQHYFYPIASILSFCWVTTLKCVCECVCLSQPQWDSHDRGRWVRESGQSETCRSLFPLQNGKHSPAIQPGMNCSDPPAEPLITLYFHRLHSH